MVTLIGEHPLCKTPDGSIASRIATVFPRRGVVVTLPGVHATQRLAYVEAVNQQRAAARIPKLTEEEEAAEWAQSVDLIIDDDVVLIRPDPEDMGLAFEADELLQEIVPKRKIRFLHVLNAKVRDAIKRRGEAWRIHPLPRSPEQMRKMILDARIGIGGRAIYYYNATSGTRWLTYQEFVSLNKSGHEDLVKHLTEIAHYSHCRNARGRVEVDFFGADGRFCADAFAGLDLNAPPAQIRAGWEKLCSQFHDAVPGPLRADDLEDSEWRNRMFCALIGGRGDIVTEAALLGLSSELFMQVEWLPGARLHEGELIFDSVFDDGKAASEPYCGAAWEDTARGLICNLIQEYGAMEYLNVGRVIGSPKHSGPYQGRRDVFIVQVKQRDVEQEELQIIRMQKWDVRERLDQGKEHIWAILESEDYTEYILDRRLACRQLGMNLSPKIQTRKLAERYSGRQRHLEGATIRSTYFQRDFIEGLSSDKMPPGKLRNADYAIKLAKLLGQAAAPNIIVGRCDTEGKLIFDDGDEVVIEDTAGLPEKIFVADHTGTFGDFRGDLRDLAPHYGVAVNRRLHHVPDLPSFAEAYLHAFVERFDQIQQEYRNQRKAFDTLFKHRKSDPGGNLAYRWECVLKRLSLANSRDLAEFIRRGIAL